MHESRGETKAPERDALQRSMGLSHATALVAGTILGAAIFVQPSEISRQVPGTAGMLAVWLLAGLLTLAGALVCAELAAVFPRTGGVYVFLRRIFSPAIGFLWGWAMFWSVHSGIIAALGLVFARYVGFFAPLDDAGTRGVAIAGILLLSGINVLGVRPGSNVQLLLTSAKVLAIVVLLAALFAFGSPATPSSAPGRQVETSFLPFLLALTAALFAYGGWHMVTYAAGETRHAGRTIPRALLAGVGVVTVCYVGLNAAYLWVLTPAEVAASTRVAADAASAVLGAKGGAAISALVILSTFGALNGIILAGPRVYYAMAEDGLAFRRLGAVHPRYRTPYVALALQAVWSCLLVATDTYRGLFTRVIYTEWIFFALLALGVLLLRRRGGFAPRFTRRAWPAIPVLFIAASLLIVFVHLLASPQESLPGILIVALGLPVYRLMAKNQKVEI